MLKKINKLFLLLFSGILTFMLNSKALAVTVSPVIAYGPPREEIKDPTFWEKILSWMLSPIFFIILIGLIFLALIIGVVLLIKYKKDNAKKNS
ncbi:MAG: hypothetical protein Q8P20_07235 [bacterium]|nr:hypothetical protein [bacterium]